MINVVCWTAAISTVLFTRLLLPLLEASFVYLLRLLDQGVTSTQDKPALAVAITADVAKRSAPASPATKKTTAAKAPVKRTRRKAAVKSAAASTAVA